MKTFAHFRFVLPVAVLFMTVSGATAQPPRIGGTVRLEAWKLHQAMLQSSPFKGLQWQVLGPKFAGGRIESIDAPRGDLGMIHAGVGAGGVWKTRNGGLIWSPIFNHESTFAIGDLTVAPSDPKQSLCGTQPTAAVVDLAVQSRDGSLVAATHGLSLFLLDIKPIRQAAKQ